MSKALAASLTASVLRFCFELAGPDWWLSHAGKTTLSPMLAFYSCVTCFIAVLQVTAAYATATNEVLLQHYGFIDADNSYDYYSANILDFIEQTVIDQPNEEQLQEVHKRPALRNALTEVRLTLLATCRCIQRPPQQLLFHWTQASIRCLSCSPCLMRQECCLLVLQATRAAVVYRIVLRSLACQTQSTRTISCVTGAADREVCKLMPVNKAETCGTLDLTRQFLP